MDRFYSHRLEPHPNPLRAEFSVVRSAGVEPPRDLVGLYRPLRHVFRGRQLLRVGGEVSPALILEQNLDPNFDTVWSTFSTLPLVSLSLTFSILT